MEILPHNLRPAGQDLVKLILSGTWLQDSSNGEIFRLEKITLPENLPPALEPITMYGFFSCHAKKIPIPVFGVVVFPVNYGLRIIKWEPKSYSDIFISYCQLEIITSL